MTEKLTLDTARYLLPRREEGLAKWAFGRALLVCGSDGMSGAALLSALSALRSGAGLVQLASTPDVIAAARAFVPEALLLPLPEEDLFPGPISRSAVPALLEQGRKAQALLFGCGAGISEDGRIILRNLCADYEGTLILDADGLNLLAENTPLLYKVQKPPVLTPHIGEFCRLAKMETDRATPQAAMDFAREHRCVVVLKGASTCVTDGEHRLVLDAPNSGMAKGGSGDVLAGLTAGLCAQLPHRPLEAAALAVWLHSRAGLLARKELGARAMLPRDVIAKLPAAFLELEG